MKEEKETCKCGGAEGENAPCPYAEGFVGDSAEECNCCNSCRNECAIDL